MSLGRTRIKWDEDRVAYMRKRAGEGAPAWKVAAELGVREVYLVYAAAKRHGISFQGFGGRESGDPVRIICPVPQAALRVLDTVARRRQVTRVAVAQGIIIASAEIGETFIDNLLDDGGA